MIDIRPFLPALLPLAIFLVLYIAMKVFQKYLASKKKRAPFKEEFFRSPGESLRWRLRKIDDEVMESLVMILTLPLLFYSLIISLYYFSEKEPQRHVIAVTIMIAAAFIVYFFVRLFRLISKRRRYRLGYDGEVAVGQVLNLLMLDGYHVYHDLDADKFNIDHVVVGPVGVFAVETKARSKPISKNPSRDAIVEYDGRTLRFPTQVETKPLEQAKRQAEWLSQWLSSATGEPVAAVPVLALPGWYVRRTSTNGFPVINPKQMKSLLKHHRGNALEDKQIPRIVHQLDQRCRNVKFSDADGLGGSPGLKEAAQA